MTAPVFASSGDLLADRRYEYALALREEGDHAAAADLLAQAVELAPAWIFGWFALGEAREAGGDAAGAIDAFREALRLDPADGLGAHLRLARLGAAETPAAMPQAYVRALFDQYASRFDAALVDSLDYRAPQLVAAALRREVGDRRDLRVLDLGCGTGLQGEAVRDLASRLAGVDLSPAMIAEAERKGVYDRLAVAEAEAFLLGEAAGSHDLVTAADVLVYVGDLAPMLSAAARVLSPEGMIGFTVEAGEGRGWSLGEGLRYRHSADHVRSALAEAGLALRSLDPATLRCEAGRPVQGFVVTARKPAARCDGAHP